MTHLKRIVSLLICTLLIITPFCFTVYAESDKKANAVQIRLDDISGNPGDTVFVPIVVTGNSGIADMAFTLTFDKKVLDYQNYYKGGLKDYTVYDHTDKGRLAFASLNGKNTEGDCNIITFEFVIKKKAKAGTYKFSLTKAVLNDEKGKAVKTETKGGKLRISKPCEGEHQYLDTKPIVIKTCTEDGISVKTCQVCGHNELQTVAATGHTPEEEFKFDIPAANGKKGLISRHCTTCGAKTNVIIYSEENTGALGVNEISKKLDDISLKNLIYFLNGSRSYPDITDEDVDADTLAGIAGGESAVKDDGSIDISLAIDRILRRFFGSDKKSGVIGTLKRAALADEIPIKLIKRLICLVLY